MMFNKYIIKYFSANDIALHFIHRKSQVFNGKPQPQLIGTWLPSENKLGLGVVALAAWNKTGKGYVVHNILNRPRDWERLIINSKDVTISRDKKKTTY